MSSSRNMSDADVIFFLSTLKRLDHVLLALDLRHPQNVQSLCHSMTREQRAEAIGRIERMNLWHGSYLEACLRMLESRSSSKTECTTSPSSSEATASESADAPKILCSSTTHFNPNLLKD